ncbi:MAG: hypothetical protein QME63_07540 [Actinomycetota bacterium]|nr:hypothetical protein [Actinomycetota bacterium]
MAVETADSKAADSMIAKEIESMEYEPLMDVEKKLIAWSLILGIVLIGFFLWLSITYFPGK